MRTFTRSDEAVVVPHPAPTDPTAVAAYTHDVAARLADGWTEVISDDDPTTRVRETWPNGRTRAHGTKNGDTRVGPWLDFFESGGLHHASHRTDDGRLVWVRYYREDGSLQEIQDHLRHDDERIAIDVFAADGRPIRRGTWAPSIASNGTVSIAPHGQVDELGPDGQITKSGRYDLGLEIRPEGPVDTTEIVAAFATPGSDARIEAITSKLYGNGMAVLRAALDRGEVSLDGDLAVALVSRLYEPHRPELAGIVAGHAADLRAVLVRHRDGIASEQYPRAELVSAVVFLWLALDPADVAAPDNRAVLIAAAHTFSNTSFAPIVDRLTPAIRALALADRERATLRYEDPEWRWARWTPTPTVIARGLTAIGKLDRKAFTYNRERETLIEEAVSAWGADAVQPVLAWWDSGGSKHAQRRFYALALARSGQRSVVPALLGFLGDALEPVRAHAVEGLAALATDDELAAALGHKKKQVREGAARALVARPRSEAVRALAERHLATETAPEVIAALEPIRTGTTPATDPAAPLRERASTLDWPALEARVGRLVSPSQTSELVRVLAHREPAWVAAIAERMRASLAEGRDGRILNLDPAEWHWARHADHPGRNRLAAEVLALLANSANGHPSGDVMVRWLHAALGDDGLREFAAHLVLDDVPPKRVKRLLTEWVELAPATGVTLFAAGLGSTSKRVRELAVQGLNAAGADAVPAVWARLTGSADQVVAAAQVLATHPDPRSVAPLEAAVALAKAPTVREALEAALGACRTSEGSAEVTDLAALDADLAGRKVRGTLPDVSTPLRWRDRTPVSEGAVRWLLATLKKEDATVRSTELQRVCGLLDPGDRAAFVRALTAAQPESSADKWVRYARGLLGDDAELDALGKGLQVDVHRHSAAFAGHGVETLRRAATPTAIRWLDHWATRAETRKLGTDAREALAALADEQGLDREGLVDRAFIGLAHADEVVRARLEAAMITGRRWTADTFRAFVLGTGQANGLVGAIIVDEVPARLFRIVGDAAVDLDGKPVPLDGQLGLPHPVELDDAVLAQWAGSAAPFPQLDRPFTRDPRAAIEALCKSRSIGPRLFVKRADAAGLQQGSPEDAGMVYAVRRRIGSWVVSYDHDGYSAADKLNPNGSTLPMRGVSYRSDDDRWDPPTDGLACEALVELRRLLA